MMRAPLACLIELEQLTTKLLPSYPKVPSGHLLPNPDPFLLFFFLVFSSEHLVNNTASPSLSNRSPFCLLRGTCNFPSVRHAVRGALVASTVDVWGREVAQFLLIP